MKYRAGACVEDLEVGECTMRAAVIVDENGTRRYWHMWFFALSEVDGQPFDFCVPMNPNGGFIENGPGGKTWGLVRVGSGAWQVSPSINVLESEVVPGAHTSPSQWHQTPTITDVPDDAPWITEAP